MMMTFWGNETTSHSIIFNAVNDETKFYALLTIVKTNVTITLQYSVDVASHGKFNIKIITQKLWNAISLIYFVNYAYIETT